MTSAPGPRPYSTRPARLACATAVLLAGVVYLNALDNPFIYDDYRLILENRSLAAPNDLLGLLLHESTRPVINISYAIDRTVWGPEPFGFHATNVLLHMLNVALLFLVVRETQGNRKSGTVAPIATAAIVSVAIFAVHPMMTQAVGYVSSRSEVLCATWLLLALLSARRWMLGASGRWLVLTGTLWLLALGTKEIAAMFPIVLILYDYLLCPDDPAERRRRLRGMHVPFVGIAALAAAARLFVLISVEHADPVEPQWWLALVELDVLRQYVALLLLPSGQSIFHAISPVSGPFDPRAVVGLALVAAFLTLAWWRRKTDGLVGFGLLWFLLLLVPSSVLVILDRGEPMAEHRIYAASMGFFMAAGAGASSVSQAITVISPRLHRLLGVFLAIWIATLAGRTVLRNAIWNDPIVVWTEAMTRAPDHWLPQLALGEELQRAGRCEEAIGRFQTSLRLHPEETTGHRKLGACLLALRRFDEAKLAFEELRLHDPGSPHVTNGLGVVALAQRKTAAARRHFHKTLELDPFNREARQGLEMIDRAEKAGLPQPSGQ